MFADLLAQIGGNVQYKQELDQVAGEWVYFGEESVGLRFDGSLSRKEKREKLLALRKK